METSVNAWKTQDSARRHSAAIGTFPIRRLTIGVNVLRHSSDKRRVSKSNAQVSDRQGAGILPEAREGVDPVPLRRSPGNRQQQNRE